MPYLVVISKGKELQRRNLDAPVTVGRAMDCDVWIDDAVLSRKHCKIEPHPEKDGWAVEDLGSRNGTYLDGKKIEREALSDGDEIMLGHSRIRFRSGMLPPSRPADPTEALLSKEFHTPPPRRPLPSKPLPTPRVSPGDTTIMPGQGAQKPLPFTRPPARPIVRPPSEDDE